MIKIIPYGNLIEAKELVIAHQVNCQSAMGSGVALAIKNRYPRHYKDFMEDNRTPEQKLGSVIKTDVYTDRIIYGLYGQLECGYGRCFTSHTALARSIAMMVVQCTNITNDFALPYLLGCGLAGGNWGIVQDILRDISKEYGVNFILYDLLNQGESNG